MRWPIDRLWAVGKQLTKVHILLRGSEQSQGGVIEIIGRIASEQCKGKGMEGQTDWSSKGAIESRRDSLSQLQGRLAAEGQGQHLLWTDAALDALRDGLDKSRGLARSWASQHQERPGLVVDHALLVRIKSCALSGAAIVGQPGIVRRLSHQATQPAAPDKTKERVPLSPTAPAPPAWPGLPFLVRIVINQLQQSGRHLLTPTAAQQNLHQVRGRAPDSSQ